MIRHDVQQGTIDWVTVRLGIPTASQFDRILTPKTMKLSAQADAYAYQLVAEQALGMPLDNASSGFMQRGTAMEREAVAFYELSRDAETEVVGFITRDDRQAGCSPDRLVGTDGLLEIKVPSAPVHIGYLLDDEGIGYKAQVQGQLWICERDWCDTLSYHPELPAALVRQSRDEAFIARLAEAVQVFHQLLGDIKYRLQRKYGLFEDAVPPLVVVDPCEPRPMGAR